MTCRRWGHAARLRPVAVDITWATGSPGGLGVFVRSLVGLDRQAVQEEFSRFLDGSSFNVSQIRFINLIIDELTANGVMEPTRLYESPSPTSHR